MEIPTHTCSANSFEMYRKKSVKEQINNIIELINFKVYGWVEDKCQNNKVKNRELISNSREKVAHYIL